MAFYPIREEGGREGGREGGGGRREGGREGCNGTPSLSLSKRKES